MRNKLFLAIFLLGLLNVVSKANGQPDPGYVFFFEDATAAPGSSVELVVRLDNNGENIEGWSFGVCTDPSQLEVVDVVLGETTANVNGGSLPFFHALNIFPDGWSVGSLISPFAIPALLPGTGYEMYLPVYSILGDSGTTATVQFCETLGSPPVSNVVVIAGQSIEPTVNDGSIEILQLGTFIRGDVSGDGNLDLSDPVELLEYLFLAVGNPGCLDSCDVNDSGALDVSDAVYLLTYMFIGGMEPPAPFPTCGNDGTVDSLECESYPGCP